jgi:predicted ATPase
VHILVTSREPLRAREERVHRLLPLGTPAWSEGLKAVDALKHPAIELFVERATASLENFELNDSDAPIVSDICRKLDGIALAIELAAGRVDALGVRGVADHLDSRFRLLKGGRRTALSRHQTLGATLDWSYGLLPMPLRGVLRRLGVFVGWFTAQSASAVVAGETVSSSDVTNAIAELIAKSLIVADVVGPIAYYRLLDTTRAYALEKLTVAGEFEATSRSHANHYRTLFEKAEVEWETRPTADWLADYSRQIDNLRAALDWTFSPNGDVAVGVSLTVAAVPLWFQLSLINECRLRVERALAALGPDARQDEHREMKLHAALGWSLMYTTGRERAKSSAWQRALELAKGLDNADYQLRALWGLWASHYNNGEYQEALTLAERFSAIAVHSTDPADPHIGDRMIGVALHFLGDQAGARQRIERMLSQYITPIHRSHIVRFQFEQRITARSTLVRALWLQGFADQALRVVDSNINEALTIGHTLTLCNALANAACPVALLAGDLIAAERYIEMLRSQTERHALDIWHAHALFFGGELLVRRGQLDVGLGLLQTSFGKLRDAQFAQHKTSFLGVLADGLARASRIGEARVAIDEALLQCEQHGERWCMSELLRINAEIELLDNEANVAAVTEQFLRALDCARRQRAPSWELRSATSLARLWRNQGRVADARSVLAPVYEQFTEGFTTTDMMTAKLLLDELA